MGGRGVGALGAQSQWAGGALCTLPAGHAAPAHAALHCTAPATPTVCVALCSWHSSTTPPVRGALPLQRLQRFATYGHLKRVVLSIIAEDLAGEASSAMASVSDFQVRHSVRRHAQARAAAPCPGMCTSMH